MAPKHHPEENERANIPKKRRRIAGFDLDSTIIKSASGNKFGKDASDWKWWDDVVPPTLKNLYAEGYLLVVFSNQGAVSLKGDPKTAKRDQKNLATFKGKLAALLIQLNLPISVYAATRRDKYRKPRTGMWDEMLEDYDLDNASLDLEGSFFVGDAAGRPAVDGGRDFAANVGIQFHTPEELFLHEPPKPFTRDFDPAMYLNKPRLPPVASNTTVFSKERLIDVVMFCGGPGSDNTNADPDTRAVWVQMARKHDVPIRCIYFNAPTRLCLHNDAIRALNCGTLNPEKRAMLPTVAFTSFSARFREPTLKEGFADITRIDFHDHSNFEVLQFEGTDEERAIWSKYWI
ncbi:hypothetical protein FGG08_002082 [Glutinoglossum americanum]|uniref:Uncharacterized protein n=1 Tax=Glutinoglossum americanum TaxID=1670608 RepID=A0A9P8L234_9PEZI|nr:hypothetical protein FGG08_002082 [Glutinoglossum americanum]